MPTLAWIVAAGVAMSLLALTGSLTLLQPEATFKQLVLPLGAHRPPGYLILVADALHTSSAGWPSGRLCHRHPPGVVTWLVAAAHAVPQELGDFGILVHSGYAPAPQVEVAALLPFATGNLLDTAWPTVVHESETRELTRSCFRS